MDRENRKKIEKEYFNDLVIILENPSYLYVKHKNINALCDLLGTDGFSKSVVCKDVVLLDINQVILEINSAIEKNDCSKDIEHVEKIISILELFS